MTESKCPPKLSSRFLNAILGPPKFCVHAVKEVAEGLSGLLNPHQRGSKNRRIGNTVKLIGPHPPPLRERSITDPAETEEPDTTRTKTTKTLDQAQSTLFTLPIEIRQLIWNHVLAGYMIHMSLKWTQAGPNTLIGRYEHSFCPHGAANLEVWRETLPQCCNRPYPIGKEVVYFDKSPLSGDLAAIKGLLNLPLSCRRIYAETIDLIYKGNIFDFGGIRPFFYFAECLPPRRLRSISKLRIIYNPSDVRYLTCESAEQSSRGKPPEPRDNRNLIRIDWTKEVPPLTDIHREAWRRIAEGMPSLRELNVQLVETFGSDLYHGFDGGTANDAGMVRDGELGLLWEPLYWPQQLDKFVVFLRNHRDTDLYREYDLNVFTPPDAPFTVRAIKALRP